MDTVRPPHKKGGSSSSSSSSSRTCDLCICLTSCVSSSSSSMKLPSKCLFSPGRTKDTLTSSLSRRLKTSGSLKGGQGQGKASPMFPLFTKKRGSAFDNPEPSSPKVTCIGQVRVKTKKQSKKLRLRASKKRRRNQHQGELNNISTTTIRSHSLRSQTQKQECLPHRNQRWVHLPMTICDAVRALGSSCVSPVKSRESSSCGVTSPSSSSSSCARWFVCLHEGDEKEREIEFVVGDEDDFERSQRGRRHVFEDIQIDESKMVHVQEQCVPPKNALLLMRCRSDPVKMSALVNRFCESPFTTDEEEEEEPNPEESKTAESPKNEVVVYEKCVFSDANEGHEIQVVQQNPIVSSEQTMTEIDQQQEEKEMNQSVSAEDATMSSSSTEVVEQNPEKQECEEQNQEKQECEEGENEFEREQIIVEEQDYDETGPSLCSSFLASLLHSESEEEKDEENDTAEESIENTQTTEEKKVTSYERFQSDSITNIDNSNQRAEHQEKESKVLPECLLLMMYEPKLSMEVSKETWVCSTDFIRWLPRKQVKKSESKDESKKLVSSTEPCKQQQQLLQQPRRSSCHYPSAAAAGVGCGGSMAAMMEQKLVKSNKGSEPAGLTRCKSEPMRSAAKLAAVQDACFLKKGLVGAAGRASFEPNKPS